MSNTLVKNLSSPRLFNYCMRTGLTYVYDTTEWKILFVKLNGRGYYRLPALASYGMGDDFESVMLELEVLEVMGV